MWRKHWRIWRLTLVILILLTNIYLSGCQSDKLSAVVIPASGTIESSGKPEIASEDEVRMPQSLDEPKVISPEQTTEPSPQTKPETFPDPKNEANLSGPVPEKSPPNTPIHPYYGLDGTPPSAPGLAMRKRVFNEEPERMAYLTFDDGPYPETTPRILKILQDEGVKATFFVLGRQVERYPDLLKAEYEQGQGIGNHSYSHDYSSVYRSPEAFSAEIKRAEDVIFKTIGVRPRILRAPGGTQGHFHVKYYNMLDAANYLVYDWNVSSGDAAAPLVPADQLIQNIETQVPGKSRVVILMHDAGVKTTTVDALPRIVNYLKQKGYSFGVITEKVAPVLFPGGFNS